MRPFEALQWGADETRFSIGDVSYAVEQHLEGEDSSTELRFYKPRAMVRQYEALFASMPPGWKPETIFELGIWHGGSAAFWSQVWDPAVLVAIDYDDPRDPPALRAFRRNYGGRTSMHLEWNVDQTDPGALLGLVDANMCAGIDLVIDDASHKYRQTRESFEILFPRVRPGGLYIIEDWSWPLDEVFLEANPRWRANEPLTRIVDDLAHAAVAQPNAVASVDIHRDFLAVHRGVARLASPVLPHPKPDPVASIRRRTDRLARTVRARRRNAR